MQLKCANNGSQLHFSWSTQNKLKHNQAVISETSSLQGLLKVFWFWFTGWTNQRADCADVSCVPAQWSQRSWPFANYRLRNPECVSFGLRAAVRPTQMLMRMKRLDCVVSAPWPMECAFKEDSQAAWISQMVFSPTALCKTSIFSSVFTQEFALVCHSWSVLLEVCFIDLVPLSLPHCPHWWNHSLRTDSICFENRNFYTDRKSTTSNSESRIALQAKNVWTRCVHSTVGAVIPTLKQYEPEAVKCGCQHLYFSRHDRPLKPWWV